MFRCQVRVLGRAKSLTLERNSEGKKGGAARPDYESTVGAKENKMKITVEIPDEILENDRSPEIIHDIHQLHMMVIAHYNTEVVGVSEKLKLLGSIPVHYEDIELFLLRFINRIPERLISRKMNELRVDLLQKGLEDQSWT